MEILDPGIHRNVPFAVYNAHPAMRSSLLKILLDGTAADLQAAIEFPEKKTSDALLKGEVLHAMVLEPLTVEHRFVFEKTPLPSKNMLADKGGSKEAWDALKKLAKDLNRTLVPYEIYQDCLGMSSGLLRDPKWRNVERFAAKELSLIADIDGVRCKARLDALLKPTREPGMIIDLKTTSKGLSDREIQGAIAEYGYHFSAAMYIEVAAALGIEVSSFRWVFLQSERPWQYRFFEADKACLDIGKLEFYKCLEIYRIAAESGIWNGYSDQTSKIGLPDWYATRKYPFGELVNDRT